MHGLSAKLLFRVTGITRKALKCKPSVWWYMGEVVRKETLAMQVLSGAILRMSKT